MKFTLAAILALAVAPANSLSYLETLNASPTQVVSGSTGAPFAEAPFFFTNGATDEPADVSPPFFFTDGSTDEPAAATKTTGSYLENLSGASSAPVVAAVSTPYLETIGHSATSTSGPGMMNYLDALPQTIAPISGAGMPSYAASLNQAASAAPVAPAAPAPAAAVPVVTPAASTTFAVANAVSYLEGIDSSSSSVSGPGLTSYLDALPRAAVLSGGSGILSYANALRTASVISGPGFNTYTDALSPSSVTGKAFSPVSTAAPAFAMGSLTGTFDFTIEADDAFIAQLRAAGNRKVTIKGKVNTIN
jgi:hypothetical protein